MIFGSITHNQSETLSSRARSGLGLSSKARKKVHHQELTLNFGHDHLLFARLEVTKTLIGQKISSKMHKLAQSSSQSSHLREACRSKELKRNFFRAHSMLEQSSIQLDKARKSSIKLDKSSLVPCLVSSCPALKLIFILSLKFLSCNFFPDLAKQVKELHPDCRQQLRLFFQPNPKCLFKQKGLVYQISNGVNLSREPVPLQISKPEAIATKKIAAAPKNIFFEKKNAGNKKPGVSFKSEDFESERNFFFHPNFRENKWVRFYKTSKIGIASHK